MPEISGFLGIIIFMNWTDHPLPHFRACYGKYEITVEIETGIVRGEFPKRTLRAGPDWLDEHKSEPMENWLLACARKPLEPIAPLE